MQTTRASTPFTLGKMRSGSTSFYGKRVLFAYTEAAGYPPGKRAPENAVDFHELLGDVIPLCARVSIRGLLVA